MKRATFTILFYVKRTKLLKNGEAPVYFRISVNGEQVETSLKRSIKPNMWDITRNKAKGNSPEALELNDYINSVRGQIFNHQKEIQESGKELTAKAILNAFLGIGEKKWSLVELFTQHNQNMQKLIGKDFSPNTFQRYEAALKHIKIFLDKQYKSNDVSLNELNNEFVNGFEFYLKSDANCQHNSAMKHVKALKKIVNLALANGYIKVNPFSNYKIKIKEVERNYLNREEIKALTEKEISIQRLDIIRDLFLFQCFTGLAFSDLAALTENNIQKGIDGTKWIYINRKKTNVKCKIPILPVAEDIIEKYSNNSECKINNTLLPVPSNQKMNAYLKELAVICGINKNLHSHLARHTYATTVTLENGVSLETVSKLLGHSKLQTTQIYSKVTERKISEEMQLLKCKMAV
jgi:site-specific recombinase XerD